MKTILFLVIEGNENQGCGGSGGSDQKQYSRLLEDECELFLLRWYNKQINKEFANIETHLICSSYNPPSHEFISLIKNNYPLVQYHHCPHDISKTFPAGWFNTPLAGKWLEENIDYDFAIHLDLDMILLKKFNPKYIDFSQGQVAKCAVYHPDFPDDRVEICGIPKKYVTCFITSTKLGLFYSLWYQEQCHIQNEYIKKYKTMLTPENKELWWDYCNIEEHAVDKMVFVDKIQVDDIEYAQFGESQGYGSINDNLEKIDELNFLHCHINNNWREQLSDYTKAKLAILTR